MSLGTMLGWFALAVLLSMGSMVIALPLGWAAHADPSARNMWLLRTVPVALAVAAAVPFWMLFRLFSDRSGSPQWVFVVVMVGTPLVAFNYTSGVARSIRRKSAAGESAGNELSESEA
ncbi:MAG: hypothetical protein HY876_01435 [Coriobacteriales bacterium]|nr:hypothetical protein [Coriobacteriales bacterium]